MDEQQQSLIDRIKQAQNVLVTVSANPSVDQLAAAIGLTVALNKLDKHGTAVFSGEVPSTLEFLKPEDTLEKNTDSLRDFIIALDKSKADKLRYKVEDQVVRIFITPYKTSLSEKDLDFSQGDFNVDVVVCLGVNEQQDLDTAITAHGRILHDATVACVSTTNQGSLGTINWVDPNASSLSEMTLQLVEGLDKKALDNQIATALLTGIVANTDRFRNEHTSPKAMSAAAELMAAGANQQLIASQLEAPLEPENEAPESSETDEPAPDAPAAPAEPGMLEIDHDSDAKQAEPDQEPAPEPQPEEPKQQIHVDEEGQLHTLPPEPELPKISAVHGGEGELPADDNQGEGQHERMTEPPTLAGSNITANTNPEPFDPSTEALTLPAVNSPILTHNETTLTPPPQPVPPQAQPEPQFIPQPPLPTPPVVAPQPPAAAAPAANTPEQTETDLTLEQIEASVHSPHAAAPTAPQGVDEARSAVEAALNRPDAPASPLPPLSALNAQPLGPELRTPAPTAAPATPNPGFSEPTPGTSPADETLDMPLPSSPFGPGQLPPQAPPSNFPAPGPAAPNGGTPPPPVPPPMLPPLPQ